MTSLLGFSASADAYSDHVYDATPSAIDYLPERAALDEIQLNFGPLSEAEELAFIDLSRFLKLPVFQGSDAFDGIFRGAIAHFFVRSLGREMRTQLPIEIKANARYALVDPLPPLRTHNGEQTIEFSEPGDLNEWSAAPYGKPSDAAMTDALIAAVTELSLSQESSVPLSSGDYAMPVNVSCLITPNRSRTRSNRYVLSALSGQRAATVISLNASAINIENALAARIAQLAEDEIDAEVLSTLYADDISAEALIPLSRALQAGIPYEELSPTGKRIVDLLLSEHSNEITAGFLYRAREDYRRFTASQPNVILPSFDEVLDNLGPLGPSIQGYRKLHADIQNSESDFQFLTTSIAELESTETPLGSGETPWSVLNERVYARLLATEGCRHTSATGTLQIRVLPSEEALGLDTVKVPIMSLFGDPQDETIFPIIAIPRLPE